MLNLNPKPIFFVRYVDDIGTPVPCKEDAVKMLSYLNSKHPTIQFEMELPDTDGFLPILDIKMKICDDGRIERKFFCKAANKGLTLNFHSHHPRSIKNAVAKNELQRAIRCSTDNHRESSIAVVRNKLSKNDFPEDMLNQLSFKKKTKPPRFPVKPRLYFTIPFVSDKFNHSVQRLLVKHKIEARLCNPRSQTILDLTKTQQRTSNKTPCTSTKCPSPKICHRSNVIYKATCKLCDATYIGMTTRPLHARALEHVAGARKQISTSAFGDHYASKHKTATPSIKFEILKHCRDELRLHIEEALAIQTHRPTLNRRKEDMGTGFLV